MKKIILLFFSFFLLINVASAASYLVPSTCSGGTKTLVDDKYYCLTNDGNQLVNEAGNCDSGYIYVNGICKVENIPTCSKGTLTSDQNNCENEDNVVPTVSITAKKVTSNTNVASDTYSNEGLKFLLKQGTVGESGATIYFCKDTNNTCTPNTVATSGLIISDYTNLVGIYYIRYKITSGSGLSSDISYFKAIVDTTVPTVTLVAKTENSNTTINSGQFTDEGLKFTFTEGSIGESGATIYYCKDTANKCTPDLVATNGEEITDYVDDVDTYYIRYKIVTGTGNSSNLVSFKAMVDKTIPSVIIGAKKVTSNTFVNSGVITDEGLKFIFTQSTIGVSGAAIYYCQDTNDRCNPTTQVTSGEFLNDYVTTNGPYYIRYKIANGLGKVSEIGSYKAMVDIEVPTAVIEARKNNSNTKVDSDTYSGEGLKFIINEDIVGASGATIYYCQDTNNSCTPTTEVTSGEAITDYINNTGTYYIRYKIVSGVGRASSVYTYKAKVDTTIPEVNLVAKKINSNTNVNNGSISDEPLKYILLSSNIGASGATIYYCKDLDNTCSPGTKITSNTELDLFNNVTGTYYIRYKVTSGAGVSSNTGSYKAIVDTTIPLANIIAKKALSNIIVDNEEYSDEGLNFTFVKENVGVSGATIYYCKDLDNTCDPTKEVNDNEVITTYNNEKGIYYIRYKIVEGTGKESVTSSYKAIVDDVIPTVSIIATKARSGIQVNSGELSDEGLKFSFTIDTIGVSGGTIYYCQDTSNTCYPMKKVNNDIVLDDYAKTNGTYYIRYVILSGTGKLAEIYSYEANVELPNVLNDYEFIYGDNQVVNPTKTEEMVFKIDAEMNKLVNLYVNGELIPQDKYTITSGSTVVTFNDTFVSDLADGQYTLTAEYTDGEATTTFVVNNAEEDNPHTGAFISVPVIGLGVLGIILLKNNKKRLYRI